VLAHAWPKPTKSAEVKSIPTTVDGYAPLVMDYSTGVLYLPFDKYLCAIDTRGFTHVWTELPKFRGKIIQMELGSLGVIVRTSEIGRDEISLIDFVTGTRIWSRLMSQKNSTNFLVKQEQIVVFTDRSLHQLDLNTGIDTVICDSAKLKGGEKALNLEPHRDGYLIYSAQNALVIDNSGNIIYHYYSNHGKKHLIEKIGSVVGETALALMCPYDSIWNNFLGPLYPIGRAIAGRPDIARRFRPDWRRFDHLYIPVDVKVNRWKETAIATVSKETGMPEKQVIIGQKDATYTIDAFNDKLILLKGHKQLVCYGM